MNKKRKKRVTIYDLATELQVAPSTVSRALQDHFSIGQETRDAVKKLAQKRGYRTNTMASNLRKQQTTTIGVLVPWINHPFISNLISGIEAEARAAGYEVIISQSQDSYKNEVANARALFDSRIHALLVSLAMETSEYGHLTEIMQSGTPVIFVDRVPQKIEGFRVMIDNAATAREATQHLIDQGCRRIALLGGARNQVIYQERERGYRQAMSENGVEIDEQLVLASNRLNMDEGHNFIRHLFEEGHNPDGIFSTMDIAAVGAMKYAHSAGIKIPDDLAVIGFNDDPVCEIIEPQLSSMSHPAADMGRKALQQALHIANLETPLPPKMVYLDTGLVVRASSLRKK